MSLKLTKGEWVRKFLCGLTAAGMLFTLTSCGGADSSGESTATTTTAATEKTPATPAEFHTTAVEKSLVTYGNTARMQEKIKKAQSGAETTVAYIGGSITEGLTAGADGCYAKLTYDHFAQTYGKGDNVKYVNAGLSGTPSILGNMRLARDVLSKNPDIVFIEFAVNDGTESDYQVSYESMVRTILSQDSDIAVVLLFSRLKNGYSAQDYMKNIGNYYNLPMISYADGITYLMDNGQLMWEQFSDDESHPNTDGHKLVAEMIDHYFDTVDDQPAAQPVAMPVAATISDRLMNMKLYEGLDAPSGNILTPASAGSFVDGSSINTFTHGWTNRIKDDDNSAATFKFKGKIVYLIYKQVATKDFGDVTIKVKINGTETAYNLSAVDPKGWGNPAFFSLGMEATESGYEVTIQMAAGSEDKQFEILGFATT
ncbi:MAG: SGNH/GDSL hydrolase family protein [Oscillospiraceae bacterium]